MCPPPGDQTQASYLLHSQVPPGSPETSRGISNTLEKLVMIDAHEYSSFVLFFKKKKSRNWKTQLGAGQMTWHSWHCWRRLSVLTSVQMISPSLTNAWSFCRGSGKNYATRWDKLETLSIRSERLQTRRWFEMSVAVSTFGPVPLG